MLTAIECRASAELHLGQISQQCDTSVALMPEPLETALTLAYFYQSVDYLATGDPVQRLAGNGPILVSKLTGAVEVAGSALPVEEYIRQFEARAAAGIP